MHVVVVFESMMGNTRELAEAIADGFRATPGVEVTCTSGADLLDDPVEVGADLLVVGAPTHFLGMPGERTRHLWVEGQAKAERGRPRADVEPEAANAAQPGVREWVDQLPEAPRGSLAAAFDTRLDKPLAGGAAPRIARRLRHAGYDMVVDPEGFIVEDMEGPLRPGELERARAWAATVLSTWARDWSQRANM